MENRMRHVLTALLLCGIAAAQDCPVQVTWISALPHAHTFAIKYTNTSGKAVKAVEFVGQFYNSLDEPTSTWSRMLDHRRVNPGSKTEIKFIIDRDFLEASRNGTEAYVKEVLFDDGTRWQDDDSHSCRMANKGRSKSH
jgi:hypothetical protein